MRGQALVIEGFGFGATQGGGAVRFPRPGGGEIAAPVAPPDWNDLAVRATVPDSAVSGTLTVTTAAGLRLSAVVHVLPRVAFDPATLAWQARPAFPRAPVGVAAAAAEFVSGAGLATTVFAAGGAEQIGSRLVPDSGVYVALAQPGGAIGAWARQRDLPAPRAFAAAAVATRYDSRFNGAVLYVIGGIDSSGRAQASVLAADVTAGGVASAFGFVEQLPAPVAGAIAVVKRGRIYVIGGTDSLGRPQQSVFVGRVGVTGHIDGWYLEPALPAPRAYGGGAVLDNRAVAFGGLADSVPPGGGLDTTIVRLATTDSAAVSLTSGFLTGPWAAGAALLPARRAQFATLDVGDHLLAVGGIYPGAGANGAETLAAAVVGDSVGPFAGPVGATMIAGPPNNGGTLVGPAGVTWRDGDGAHHGLVIGGIDLVSQLRKGGVWGF